MKKARLFISVPVLPSDLVDLHQFFATLLPIIFQVEIHARRQCVGL